MNGYEFTDSPYDRPENAYRTDGRDVCHWCALRPQAWLWAPFSTRVCDHCQQLIEDDRGDEIAEEIAARFTVRGTFDRFNTMIDPDRWLAREHALFERWLDLRTTCTALAGDA